MIEIVKYKIFALIWRWFKKKTGLNISLRMIIKCCYIRDISCHL